MYINTQTNQYPVSEAEIRAAFSNVSFASPFTAPDEYKVVFPAPQPAYDSVTQGVREAAPELTVKGTWEQRWEIYALDADTIAANQAAAAKALQASIVAATQKRLDDFAATRGYDDIKSACDYAGQTAVPRFQVEGQYCLNQRAATWAKLYDVLAEIESGTRPVPSGFPDIEPELPALEWPNP